MTNSNSVLEHPSTELLQDSNIETPYEELELPPNLINYVTKGYNILNGDFMSDAIFELNYEEHKREKYRYYKDGKVTSPVDCKIPDSVKFDYDVKNYQQNTTTLLTSSSDYDEKLSAEFEAEYSGAFFSGSANSQYEYHGSLFHDYSSEYTVNLYSTRVYLIEQTQKKIVLTDEFKEVVKSAPSDTTDKSIQKWKEIFNDYGTHFLIKGTVGGWKIMESGINSSTIESESAQSISAGISAGFNGMVSKGSFSAQAAYENSSFLQENEKNITVTTAQMGGILEDDLKVWNAELNNDPALILMTQELGKSELKGLDYFLTSDEQKKSYLHALEFYVKQLQSIDGFISRPEVIPFNKSVKVKTDGFYLSSPLIIATIGAQVTQFIAVGKEQGDMHTACIAGAYNNPNLHDIYYGSSAFVPVSKGSYLTAYNQKKVQGHGQFFPVANIEENLLGNIVTMEVSTAKVKIEEDGFILYSSDSNDATFEYESAEFTYQMVCNTERRVIIPANVCMPVRAGGNIWVSEGSVTPENVKFIAIPGLLKNGSARKSGIEYQSESSGILTVSGVNTITVTSWLLGQKPKTVCHSAAWLVANSMTVPILKGFYYKVECSNYSGYLVYDASIYFHPMSTI